MKTSELIAQLQALVEKHGDLPVIIDTIHDGWGEITKADLCDGGNTIYVTWQGIRV